MKRIVCILLSLCMIFVISACGNKNDAKSDVGLDIEKNAKLGKIPETEFSIGSDIASVKAALQKVYDDKSVEEAVYNVVEKDDYVKIDGGNFQYYYKKGKDADGVSYIVSFDTSFGITLGTVDIEITEKLNGFKYIQEDLTKQNAFFVLGEPEGIVYKYGLGDNTVAFFFVDDALYATAIYKAIDWE